MVNTTSEKNLLIDEIGDDHYYTSDKTPLRDDAFNIDDATKIELIADHFKEIMNILGLDLTDDSLAGTPKRVAKMYVNEIFNGLNPKNEPPLTLFDNNYAYNEMLVEKNIRFYSNCEHHFVPIIGFVNVAYVSTGKVIGLSKLHRIVDFFARRPQVQERLTVQIANALKKALSTEDVAVIVSADHQCVSMRGVKDQTSSTVTSAFHGVFKNKAERAELMSLLQLPT